MSKSAKNFVAQCVSWLGKNEKDGSFKEIIDIYNSQKTLPRGYRMKYTDEWCACFVSAAAVKLGYTELIPTECSCARMIENFKKLDVFIEDESRVPNVGDIIFYDWNDDAKGDNKGHPDHVGVVEKVTGQTFTVIEGNMSQKVGRRTMHVDARYIRGYAVPHYESEHKSFLPKRGYFRYGDWNKNVGKISEFMYVMFPAYTSKKARGTFYGRYLKAAITEFQQRTGLEPDGCVGPLTLCELIKYGFNYK